MAKTIGLLADRLFGAVLPKTTAGACPCNDTYCTYSGCPAGKVRSCHANCNCSIVKCGACYVGYC